MAKNITLGLDEKKVRHALRNVKEEKAYELADLLQRAYQPQPDPKDLDALRKWLDKHPDIWCLVFDISTTLEKNLIQRILPDQAAHLALDQNVEQIRSDLGRDKALPLERMLIDNIVLSWLHCQYVEYRLILHMGDDGSTAVGSLERRLVSAQTRYLRACESLARIRRLSIKDPTLQVNIASQGGQQVNVAGDVGKK